MEILHAIEKSAHLYGNPNYELGYGIPDFSLADEMLELDLCVTPQDPFLVFPNPAVDRLTILKGPNVPTQVRIDLIDTNGKLLFSEKYPDSYFLEILLSPSLASGVYYIRLSDDDRFTESIKFHIIHE